MSSNREHNDIEMPKRLLEALIASHFFQLTNAIGAPLKLDRPIEEIKIVGDKVIINYKKEENQKKVVKH